MNTPVDLRSPYQPPATDVGQGPPELPVLQPHERSGAPKVFGVLSTIFASLGLLTGAIGLLFSMAAGMVSDLGSKAGEGIDAATTAMMGPMAKVYQGFGLQNLIVFVMSILLLVIGIGQLRYRAWACRWSVYWGVAGLVCVGLMVAISVLIVSPGYAAFLDSLSHIKPAGEGQAPMPSMGPLSGIVGGTFAAINVVLYAPYPALMLLFFTRERVRASMQS